MVQLTDATGAVTQEYEYDAFGNERNPSANDTNPLRYCGEYFDAETGTIYLRARYYDPRIGRFTAIDPAGSGLNWYTYCGNNPIAFIDWRGLFEEVPGNYSPDDWIFFGFNGDELIPSPGFGPDSIPYEFGITITDTSKREQWQMELHIVDRIARTLYSEHTTSMDSRIAIAWTIFNRAMTQNKTLYQVMTGRGQYESYLNEGGNILAFQPDVTSEGWQHSLQLAKYLVSAAGNPFYDNAAKTEIFESWVANPFKSSYSALGGNVGPVYGNLRPYNVIQYRGSYYWNPRYHNGILQEGSPKNILGYRNIGNNVFFDY